MSDYIHTIKVTELSKRDTYNGASDVISHARWLLKTYHKDYPDEVVSFNGVTPLKISAASLEAENFKPLDQLTEDVVVEWIYANANNLGLLKYNNEKELKSKLFPETKITSLPWQ
jgi:hypothetical protein